MSTEPTEQRLSTEATEQRLSTEPTPHTKARAPNGSSARVRELEAELRSARAGLAAREQAFARLNRRLLELEREEGERSNLSRAELAGLESHNRVLETENEALASDNRVLQSEIVSLRAALDTARARADALAAEVSSLHESERASEDRVREARAELDALRTTKLFRWSIPARNLYASLRKRT